MKKVLRMFIPLFIRKKIYNTYLETVKKRWEENAAGIPTYDLEAKHIAHTKLLLTREDLLERLPKNGIAAELGVDEGGFSEKILRICTPAKLHLIDLWGSDRYNQNKRQHVEQKFTTEIQENKLEINLGYSTEVVIQFKEAYFDFIYIDTVHDYTTTFAELELYRSKIKPGGIMAGHDYILGNWNGMVRYGVIEAVYEFCVKYNWEIIYITMENNNFPSFAIQEIKTSN